MLLERVAKKGKQDRAIGLAIKNIGKATTVARKKLSANSREGAVGSGLK